MSISLRQLEAFVAVCNEGNFSKAAQRIHISQSGLSILIRELEQSLECRLFDRSTRQVSLTDAGREFRGRPPACWPISRRRSAMSRGWRRASTAT